MMPQTPPAPTRNTFPGINSSSGRRVLLLNPPAPQIVIRDGHCSYTAKADYCWPPIDLLIQSGLIQDSHTTEVLDCNVLRLTTEESLHKIREVNCDVILSLTGFVSWKEDFSFFSALLLEKPDTEIFLSGDMVLEDAERILEQYTFIKGALGSFTSTDFLDYLNGERRSFEHLAWENEGTIVPRLRPRQSGHFSYSPPNHLAFPIDHYRITIGRESRFTTVMTSTGCNFKCPFCIDADLKLGLRDIDNLFEEFDMIRETSISEIYFYDPNFTAKRARVVDICNRLIDGNYNFRWMANGQVACLNDEIVELMAKAGCHTIMLGLESADDEILRKNRKGFTRLQAESIIKSCHTHGIRVLGYFVFGLPGDTLDSMNKTTDYAISLNISIASFSVFTPLVGTPLWRALQPNDYLSLNAPYTMNRSKQPGTKTTGEISNQALLKIQSKAYRRFYLRPGYILQRLKDFESLPHALRSLRAATSLILKQFS